jgi:peptidyl-prolyl cis-trans isomerase B (cyclophilin B)
MKKYIFVAVLALLAILLASIAFRVNTDNRIAQDILQDLNSTTTIPAAPQNTTATATSSQNAEITQPNQVKKMNLVTLQTNKGEIKLELSSDKPNTTANFIKLAQSGFYDGVKFHRVIRGFMIQAGDPQSKDESLKSVWGTGGPGYKFADELTGRETYPQGTLAMANAGPNTNGSQFFIVSAVNAPLPPSYTVFGKVVAGLDTVLAIEKVATDGSDKPLENVVIQKVLVQ